MLLKITFFRDKTVFMFYKKKAFPLFKINSINRITFLIIGFFLGQYCYAQTQKRNQFENTYEFNKVIGKKTALEINLNHLYTSSDNENNPFENNSRVSGWLWLHYFASKKWKISTNIGYVYNHDVPEINQKQLPEIRLSAQGIYYFIKKDYVLTNRLRIEDRILTTEDSGFDVIFRLREMVKLVYPISVIKFGKGSLYGIVSDEVFFKTKSQLTSDETFDRNRFTVGLGYSFSDAFQFELTYLNDYIPRSTNDRIHNTLGTRLIFNDIISILRKKNGNIPTY